jgi:zinc protease
VTRGAAAATERPEIGVLRLPEAPEVVEDELAGGLKLLAAHRPSVPMVELRFSFPLPASEIESPATSIVLSESLLAGTGQHDRAELAAAVERLGGQLGASHDSDRFVVGGAVLAANLAEWLDLVAEVLVGASYEPTEVDSDRDRVADETIISLSQPGVIAAEALRRRMYPGHPAATSLPAPETIREVSPEALRATHGSVLSPRTAQLVMVGDLDTAGVRALVEERLGTWLHSAGAVLDTQLPPLPGADRGPIEFVDRPGSVQSNVLIGLPAVTRADPAWPASSLANLIFGGLFASRLVVNLRERNGYSYSPRSSISHGRAGSTLVVRAEVGSESTAAALVEMRYELGHLAVSGIEDAELEAARRYALGSLSFLTATQAGLAGTLSSLAAVGIGPGYLASNAAALASATKEQVDEAARRLFAAPGSVTAIVGDAEQVTEALSAVDSIAVRAASEAPS